MHFSQVLRSKFRHVYNFHWKLRHINHLELIQHRENHKFVDARNLIIYGNFFVPSDNIAKKALVKKWATNHANSTQDT